MWRLRRLRYLATSLIPLSNFLISSSQTAGAEGGAEGRPKTFSKMAKISFIAALVPSARIRMIMMLLHGCLRAFSRIGMIILLLGVRIAP